MELLSLFVEPMERAGFQYMVTGSIASMLYSEPRLTHDVDIVIQLAAGNIPKFLSLFPEADFYSPPAEVIQIESGRSSLDGHFNLIHHGTGQKADCYPRKLDAFYRWAFENRRRAEMPEGFSVWLAPPGYVVVRKLQYHREGGSWKHLEDIRGMIRLEAPGLDDPMFLAELKRLDLEAWWEKAKAL